MAVLTADCLPTYPSPAGPADGRRPRRGGRHEAMVDRRRMGARALSEAQVTEIREKYATGEYSQAQLAAAYGVVPSNISVIVRGLTFGHLPTVGDPEAVARARHQAQVRRPRPARRLGLQPAQVGELRARYAAGGVSMAALAREYGLDASTVGRIIRGETWRYLPGAAPEGSHALRGEDAPWHKLTAQAVRAIRREHQAATATQAELAQRYSVSRATISHIVNYRKWRHVKDEEDEEGA